MGALCWWNHYAARPLCFWMSEQDAELGTRGSTRPPSQGHPETSEGWRRKPPAAASVGPGVKARGATAAPNSESKQAPKGQLAGRVIGCLEAEIEVAEMSTPWAPTPDRC